MKVFSALRRVAPAVVVVALLLLTASCATNRKYGCPNHVNSGSRYTSR